MQDIRKLPLGIQSFEKLRKEDYLYVDKTELIHKLITTGRSYFLSRPRRFGKSLLVSTLEAYFLGKKDLFKGLALENLEQEWIKYPVIKFSLAGGDFTTENGLYDKLKYTISDFETQYELPKEESFSLPVRFNAALKNANKKTGLSVVVLVDEYDTPILKTMDLYPELEQKSREFFKSFFATLKDADEYLHFVFFTGVTKFSKVSIFSDLNQLIDISMDKAYSALCGITQDELENNFMPNIEALATEEELSKEECLNKLKQMYDGYKFSANGTNVYNPYSLFNSFNHKTFGSYWFETATPTFLINKLKAISYDIRNFSNCIEASALQIQDYRADNPDIVPLLYQSGYLTIKSYDKRRERYTLSYPNDEVKYSFMESLAPSYLNTNKNDSNMDIYAIDNAIEHGNINTVKEQLFAVFARLPYANSLEWVERDFQNVIYIIFMMLGKYVHVELHSAKGRADCIVETDKYVYIFEFKVDSSAEEALKQIEQKGYASPYAADKRKIFSIGINFSTNERNIKEMLVKTDGLLLNTP